MRTSRHFSLLELNSLVQDIIEQTMQQQYWVEAELSDVGERRGHLFLDLVQRGQENRYGSGATPIARASAKCWANAWGPIRAHFERVTGQPLSVGMKVLLQVYPKFHPAYGFSWIVTDIDPTFTLGDMARRRMEIIQQLKDEGVFDLQKELRLPIFCHRIAVISSATAAGYGDFCNQLNDNEYGFNFETKLYPAIMQGEQVESSVIAALDAINNSLDNDPDNAPDVVVIIRGGGATVDMSGFDTLLLAECVAQFPIPIITGIGHDRDECILDMVAHTHVKTPTAAAAFLISHLATVNEHIINLTDRMGRAVQQRLENERLRLTTISTRIPTLFSLVKVKEETRLERAMQRITTALQNRLQREQHRLEMMSQRCKSVDPQIILNRGYSITTVNGKAITDQAQLKDGDTIQTRLANGTVESIVRNRQQ